MESSTLDTLYDMCSLLTLNILVLKHLSSKLRDDDETEFLTAICAEAQFPIDFGIRYVSDDVILHLWYESQVSIRNCFCTIKKILKSQNAT